MKDSVKGAVSQNLAAKFGQRKLAPDWKYPFKTLKEDLNNNQIKKGKEIEHN